MTKSWCRLIRIFVLITLITMVLAQGTIAGQKIVIGWLEKVYLPQYEFALRGKMDTGAKNSSLHAVDIQYVNQKGKSGASRVRFKVIDSEGEYRIMEADVLGTVKIKKPRQINEEKLTIDMETRPVVELEICLAGITKRIPVNLTNRAGMNYRFILGRTALAVDFIVDVSKKFIYGFGTACREQEHDATGTSHKK